MARYITRRVLWGIALLFIVSALVFVLFYVFPSADPAQLRAGRQANEAQIQAIRESLGLDKSVLTQFWIFIKGVFTPLDLPGTDETGPLYFGHSYQSNADVFDVIKSDIPATALLVFGSVVIWLAVAIPVGIISAVKSRTLLDRTSMITALAFISAPVSTATTPGTPRWRRSRATSRVVKPVPISITGLVVSSASRDPRTHGSRT